MVVTYVTYVRKLHSDVAAWLIVFIDRNYEASTHP